MQESESEGALYQVVRTVPAGVVVTYGQVAGMVETLSVSPREVGRIMNVSPEDVPWQRVVGAGGHLPIGKRSPQLAIRQRALLEREGVQFLENGTVDMERFQWRPAAAPESADTAQSSESTGSLFEE